MPLSRHCCHAVVVGHPDPGDCDLVPLAQQGGHVEKPVDVPPDVHVAVEEEGAGVVRHAPHVDLVERVPIERVGDGPGVGMLKEI